MKVTLGYIGIIQALFFGVISHRAELVSAWDSIVAAASTIGAIVGAVTLHQAQPPAK